MKNGTIFKVMLTLIFVMATAQSQATIYISPLAPSVGWDETYIGSSVYTTVDSTAYMSWWGDDPVNPDALDMLAITGNSGIFFDLYKSDVSKEPNPPVESGSFLNYYTTTFSNSQFDPEDALLHHDGGPAISGGTTYLILKDGNDPKWYVYDISYWNGTEDIQMEDFWVGNGAISHISIVGTSSPVPEPATMLLFGTGLIGLAGARLRRKKV